MFEEVKATIYVEVPDTGEGAADEFYDAEVVVAQALAADERVKIVRVEKQVTVLER